MPAAGAWTAGSLETRPLFSVKPGLVGMAARNGKPHRSGLCRSGARPSEAHAGHKPLSSRRLGDTQIEENRGRCKTLLILPVIPIASALAIPMSIRNLLFPLKGEDRDASTRRCKPVKGGHGKSSHLAFAPGIVVAAVLSAAFPAASRAAPLDSILPPAAGNEGAPATAAPIRPGTSSIPSSGQTETTAPPLEDITAQTIGPNAGSMESGEPIPGAIAEGSPTLGPPVPPGFAWPAILSTRNWFKVQDWYGEFDAQALDHTRQFRHNPLLVDTSDGRIIDREDLNLGLAAGAHITLGTYLGEDYQNHDHSLEFTFQGLDDWNGHFNIIAATPSTTDTATTFGNFGSLVNLLNFPNADFFNGADFYHFDYHSDLNSFEVNVRSQDALPRRSVGLRSR